MAKKKKDDEADEVETEGKSVKGKGHSVSGEELVKETQDRDIIPLTLSLDIALGSGIPLGSTVLFGGKPKTGKTTISLQVGANAQRLYGSKVFFFPIEGRLTHKVIQQIRDIKLDKDSFEVIRGDPIVYKGKTIGFKKMPSEWWYEKIGQTIIDNPRSVIIVDSIANMMSEKQISEDLGYQDRGADKMIEGRFGKMYGEHVISNQVTLILLTQVIANTSGYGAALQMKVGNQLRHQCDVWLFAKSIDKWTPEGEKIRGHNIVIDIEEAPNAAPYSKASVPLRYGYGIDNIQDTVDHAVNFGFIGKGGAWYVMPKFEKTKTGYDITPDENGEKIQGVTKVRDWFLGHPDECIALENHLRTMILGPEATNLK